MEPQELETLDLNGALAEILQAHGYTCQMQSEKSCPISPYPYNLKLGRFRANTPTAQ